MKQKRKRFTREESERLFGRRVRAGVAFSDIIEGTTGVVIGTDEVEADGFEIIIKWEGIEPGAHQTDWFTKEVFDVSLADE